MIFVDKIEDYMITQPPIKLQEMNNYIRSTKVEDDDSISAVDQSIELIINEIAAGHLTRFR